MRFFVSVALVLISTAGVCETLGKEALIGLWETNWPTTKGEDGTLCIREDFSSTFTRDFPESTDQRFSATEEAVHCRNEICSFSYFSEDSDYGYRVVVSGWEVGGTVRLFGTLFMYREGGLFNGLPISFEKVNKPKQPTQKARGCSERYTNRGR